MGQVIFAQCWKYYNPCPMLTVLFFFNVFSRFNSLSKSSLEDCGSTTLCVYICIGVYVCPALSKWSLEDCGSSTLCVRVCVCLCVCICVCMCVWVCPALTACISITLGWILMKLGGDFGTWLGPFLFQCFFFLFLIPYLSQVWKTVAPPHSACVCMCWCMCVSRFI